MGFLRECVSIHFLLVLLSLKCFHDTIHTDINICYIKISHLLCHASMVFWVLKNPLHMPSYLDHRFVIDSMGSNNNSITFLSYYAHNYFQTIKLADCFKQMWCKLIKTPGISSAERNANADKWYILNVFTLLSHGGRQSFPQIWLSTSLIFLKR